MAGNLAIKTVLNTLHYCGASAVLRPFFGGNGAILMLHHVRDEPNRRFAPNAGLTVTPLFLDCQLRRLKRKGFEFVSLDECIERLQDPSRGSGAPFLAMTLDDGYQDNLENAVPLFRKHDVPYTIYVASGLVDGSARLWWEDLEAVVAARDRFFMEAQNDSVSFDVSTSAKKRAVYAELMEFFTASVGETEQRSMVEALAAESGIDAEAHRASQIMDWSQIADLASDPLCTIGAHTVDHYAIARLDEKQAMFELREGARVIEMETGIAPRHFAFPYGYASAAGPRDFALAQKAGFTSAVTTRHGVVVPAHGDHLHALPRISLNGHFQAARYVDALLSGLPARIENRGRALNVA